MITLVEPQLNILSQTHLLLGLTTISFVVGLFFLSMKKLVSEDPLVSNLLEDWDSFIPTSIFCSTLFKKIGKDKRLESVGKFMYVAICLLVFLVSYVANDYVEKSTSFVAALFFFLIDLLLTHILSGAPSFGLLEVLAAMVVGTSYDVPELWLFSVAFVLGFLIVLFNWYIANNKDEPDHSSPQHTSIIQTTSPKLSDKSSGSKRHPINTTSFKHGDHGTRSEAASPTESDTEAGTSKRRNS